MQEILWCLIDPEWECEKEDASYPMRLLENYGFFLYVNENDMKLKKLKGLTYQY